MEGGHFVIQKCCSNCSWFNGPVYSPWQYSVTYTWEISFKVGKQIWSYLRQANLQGGSKYQLVVYFDKQMGALHTKHWLNNVFCIKILKNLKQIPKKCSTCGKQREHRSFSLFMFFWQMFGCKPKTMFFTSFCLIFAIFFFLHSSCKTWKKLVLNTV